LEGISSIAYQLSKPAQRIHKEPANFTKPQKEKEGGQTLFMGGRPVARKGRDNKYTGELMADRAVFT